MKFMRENGRDEKAEQEFLECSRGHKLGIMALGIILGNPGLILRSRIKSTRLTANEKLSHDFNGVPCQAYTLQRQQCHPHHRLGNCVWSQSRNPLASLTQAILFKLDLSEK